MPMANDHLKQQYWTTMNNALTQGKQNMSLKGDANSIVVAPQFFSTKYNSGVSLLKASLQI
jgi:hypothetical protein